MISCGFAEAAIGLRADQSRRSLRTSGDNDSADGVAGAVCALVRALDDDEGRGGMESISISHWEKVSFIKAGRVEGSEEMADQFSGERDWNGTW